MIRVGGVSSPTRGVVAALAVLSVVAACSGDDGNGADTPDTLAPPTAVATTTSPTSPTSAPEPSLPEFALGNQISSIEVSARLVDGTSESVLTIEVGQATLDRIPASGPDDAPAWCTGATEPTDDEGYLVRVGPAAIDVASGGVERFELRSDQTVTGPGPVAAVIEMIVDGRALSAPDAVLDVLDDLRSGTFRGVAAGDVVIEGAFRCS